MYRSAPSLSSLLAERLGPLGFAEVAPDDERKASGVLALYRRKTWSTNRGVVLAAPTTPDLRAYVETMRASAGGFLGSSWWNQLGLQVVLEVAGPPPPSTELDRYVDKVNTQGILVQSVFAYDRTTRQSTSARTWGQVFTGRFQDAIQGALDALAR
ncbi:MAG: hypothetical protein KIT84_19075 [Labilithrix sp.]|nr:hypothetical protein [Labilithrix sp.]MCW5813138.1 hypothetical protein [Labilithrix sp.]